MSESPKSGFSPNNTWHVPAGPPTKTLIAVSGGHSHGESCCQTGYCMVCGEYGPVERTTHYYGIQCECHSPEHFGIVYHCPNCTPQEPTYTSVEFRTEDLKNLPAFAMKILRPELAKCKAEGSYYHTLQSNIACAIMDTMPQVDNIHELANTAAKKFLDLLIGE